MGSYEYTVKTYTMEELEKRGIVVHPHNNIVFACHPNGKCSIHDVGVEQMESLSSLFNEMGTGGWELLQIMFHQSGIISFWKRFKETEQK